MEKNMTLRMDEDTFDLSFDADGVMETRYGDDTTAQCVRLTLLAYKEEFPLDVVHGTGYRQFLGVPASDAPDLLIQDVVRQAIYQERSVAVVHSIDLQRDGRALSIAFDGTLDTGQPIHMEVRR